jgi:hypothetical protein
MLPPNNLERWSLANLFTPNSTFEVSQYKFKLILPSNIGLPEKKFPGTNALSYFTAESATKKKCFLTLKPA